MKSRGFIAVRKHEHALDVIREYGVNSRGGVGFKTPDAALKDALRVGYNKSGVRIVEILTRTVPKPQSQPEKE